MRNIAEYFITRIHPREAEILRFFVLSLDITFARSRARAQENTERISDDDSRNPISRKIKWKNSVCAAYTDYTGHARRHRRALGTRIRSENGISIRASERASEMLYEFVYGDGGSVMERRWSREVRR